MPIDLLDIFHILTDSCKIRVTEEKTSQISLRIQGLKDPEQIVSCIRVFLSYYPEESLIDFCLDRLFINARPDYLSGPKHSIWIREVTRLAEVIISLRVPKWEEVMRTKMKFYCPQLVDQIWKDWAPTTR